MEKIAWLISSSYYLSSSSTYSMAASSATQLNNPTIHHLQYVIYDAKIEPFATWVDHYIRNRTDSILLWSTYLAWLPFQKHNVVHNCYSDLTAYVPKGVINISNTAWKWNCIFHSCSVYCFLGSLACGVNNATHWWVTTLLLTLLLCFS